MIPENYFSKVDKDLIEEEEKAKLIKDKLDEIIKIAVFLKKEFRSKYREEEVIKVCLRQIRLNEEFLSKVLKVSNILKNLKEGKV